MTRSCPVAGILAARIIEARGDMRAALTAYLAALESAPGLALEIIPRVLAISSELGDRDIVEELTEAPAEHRPRERAAACVVAGDGAAHIARGPVAGAAVARSRRWRKARRSARCSRASAIPGGRYQCDDCGLHSVGWYWRCPKCRSWDTLRPAVFKWAERGGRFDRTVERSNQAPNLVICNRHGGGPCGCTSLVSWARRVLP